MVHKEKLQQIAESIVTEFTKSGFVLGMLRNNIKKHVTEERAKQILEYLHKETKDYEVRT